MWDTSRGGELVFLVKKLVKKTRGKNCQRTYILTTWVNDHNLCIGQQKVEDKSNEITAIPKLLDSLDNVMKLENARLSH